MSDDRTQIPGHGSAIGTELNQTYKIDSLIGVGGMGEVFKGHNIQTGDPVAIKIVLPEFARDEMILELFRKEARILNHLNHDAIVRYYVFSIDRFIDRPYLAMEFVDGESLADRVKATPLEPDDFMPLLKRLADGLHKAHEAGVIHRDMSPDNVILPGGLVRNAKIIDFGIARSANVGGATLLGGSFAGKYSYVSPEQLGLFGGEVTPKSDVYSLALVMAAAMRGQPINMSGSQVEVIDKRRAVPGLDGIPKRFHALLSAMLQPDPAKRPASMAEVRDWPDETMAAKPKPGKKAPVQPPGGQSAGISGPERQSNTMRNVAFGLAAVAVVGIGVLTGWVIVNGNSTDGTVSDVTNEVKPETTAEVKPETKPDVQPETQPEVKPETTAEVQPETQPEVKPETTPDIKPETKPAQIAAGSLRDFVKDFGAGSCLATTAVDVSDTAAAVTLVASAEASAGFSQAFAAKAGFTPKVTVNQVSDAQCAFVAALHSLAANSAQPIDLKVSKSELRGNNAETGAMGDPLNLTVTGIGERNLYLFVVDHNGGIQNINRLCASCIVMTPQGMTAALSLFSPARIEGTAPPPFYPMLVFAVASAKPLISINSQDAFDTADFIAPFQTEIAAASDVSTAISYVKLTDQ